MYRSGILLLHAVAAIGATLGCRDHSQNPAQSSSIGSNAVPQASVDFQDLVALPSWNEVFESQDLSAYIACAKRLQAAPHESVERLLEEVHRRDMELDPVSLQINPQIFVLLRIMFAVPRVMDRSDAQYFDSFIRPRPTLQTFLSWPIICDDTGQLHVVSPFDGAEGNWYNPLAEYRYLREHFQFRVFNHKGDESRS